MTMEQERVSGGGPRVIVVGAGPGGLTAAMLLAARGFRVTVFEKSDRVGGRNGALVRNGYKFDIGPTFLMMRFILDEVFREAGRRAEDYLKFVRLEPMYRLQFHDRDLELTTDPEEMRRRLEEVFPGSSAGYDRFRRREAQRFRLMYPCLQKDYSSWLRAFSPDLIRALPHLSLGRSLIQVLGGYFGDDLLRLAFTFQAKYLGMSAWECPGFFAILSYIEHGFGIWHVMGGLSEISEAMARVCREYGVELRLSTPVHQLVVEGRKVVGVELRGGERVLADATVLNADFGYAMKHLAPPGLLRKYAPERVDRLEYSCSTFMLYLGLDRLYSLPHHTIFFARDYRANLEDIFQRKVLPRDPSFYVRNASVTDPSLAPPGHSAVYVLVPVPNLTASIDWEREAEGFQNRVLDLLETRAGMAGLRYHIRERVVFTPQTWASMGIQYGATFNLSHKLSQMLFFRPHNRFEELDQLYLVGGGTHPGSGLPTIYESGRIAANMICRAHRVPFVSQNQHI